MTLRDLAAKRSRGSLLLSEWGPVCVGCSDAEFRIDGYCSIECRDYHSDEMFSDLATLCADMADWLDRVLTKPYRAEEMWKEGDALLARYRDLNERAGGV